MNRNQFFEYGLASANGAAPFQARFFQPENSSGKDDRDAFSSALSIVAHDLRGPLANLALLIEDIERSAQDERSPAIAGKATRADRIVQQMSGMLSAILKRARDNRDPLSCDPAPVNLVDILELAVTVNQPLARQRSVRFCCHAIDPVPCSADAELLYEVFDNLIGNAVKHTRPDTTVICETGPADDGGTYVRISDEGPGFTAADLMRAFRPFTRLSSKAGSEGHSSGLGLWIARLIAERHGGRIEAKNRKDTAGAELTLWLPPTRPGDTKPATARKSNASRSPYPFTGGMPFRP
ncbi:sensor histidine kinase [Roseibium aggregatum]|uniref:histidine kinase n=1 Tax=Roseibium aggregatum TaxID=187304 RepID=A0A939J5Q8_9HYPH|nr:HAMP domain-containing sensor histidine kinase [Roseibium aggregatum]MBN9671984.1 HAMP domain-containing histidine kinase [Roseibium aggregatum]